MPLARALTRRLVVVWVALAACLAGCDSRFLGAPDVVADGVRLYHVTDSTLLDGPGPIAIDLLRLDSARVDLASALALDEVMGREPVLETSRRHGAIAAVNAGFFLPNGEPAGILKVGGELVSETNRARGAVGILPRNPGRFALLFDRVTARVSLRLGAGRGTETVEIAGVDTTRRRGALMLYTPRYHEHTDTAGNGTEWTLRGVPARVVERRHDAGRSPIPRDGFVLSFGGLDPPGPVGALDVGAEVALEWRYQATLGTSEERWHAARDVIGGAGLLVKDGRALEDWTDEQLREGFSTERHPRTMIGVDQGGDVWLVTVDGRQPGHSVGMTFAELQGLAARLGLRDALNLDGGGSTTMVVGDRIVNHPSDEGGPRAVSDALLVLPRGRLP